jgi:hypothetical protein
MWRASKQPAEVRARRGTLVPAPGSPYTTDMVDTAMAAGDFNGDGLPDLAHYSVMSGSASTAAIGFGAADFNRDGNIDLAYVCGSAFVGTVSVLLGDGTGNFSPVPGSLSIGPYASQFTVADFNKDGNPDVAVSHLTTNQVAILLGDGTGRLFRQSKRTSCYRPAADSHSAPRF